MKKKMSIMVVDDESIVRESLYHWFAKSGHTVDTAASGLEALEKLERVAFDILFVDIKMPGMDGIELLKKVKSAYPDTIVIIITAYGSIESSIKAMKTGASDYLLKPFKPDYLSLVLEKVTQQQRLTEEYNYLKGHLERINRFVNIIGQSHPMQKIFDIIPNIANNDTSILLTGETGTGKELIARAIHAKSPRAHCPFIAINCGAVPDSLLESELFGHVKGAFTDAAYSRKGFLEVVNGGTLFLDEVGEISPKMQIDLLRVLEEKKITRIGSSEPLDVDFRLVSATRCNVEEAIERGDFREDFYYRINVIRMHVPPLRKRIEDLVLLANHFLNKYSQETAKQVDHVSEDTLALLKQYSWPGNVRELENAIERAVVLARSRTLTVEDFGFLSPPARSEKKARTLKEMERTFILETLEDKNWNITRAAGILGINRVTLHKKIDRFKLKAYKK